MRLDIEKILSEYKENHPEYRDAELHIEAKVDSYAVMDLRNRVLDTVQLPENIDYGPLVFGYARVSSKGQAKDGNSLEAQAKALKDAGAKEIFTDVYTGTTTDRPELEKLLSILQEGDMLIVTKLDRIARSVQQGISLIEELAARGVKVNVLNMGLMDNTPTGKLIRNVMLAFAEFERDMIMQRTREGKEVARQLPEYKEGRKPKYSKEQINHALELLETNSYSQVTRLTGISKSTLIRARKM
jgi:DNA invertase Pin-like site-specific DNA recombinase